MIKTERTASSTVLVLVINSSFNRKGRAYTEHTVYKMLTHHSVHVTIG